MQPPVLNCGRRLAELAHPLVPEHAGRKHYQRDTVARRRRPKSFQIDTNSANQDGLMRLDDSSIDEHIQVIAVFEDDPDRRSGKQYFVARA